MSIYVKKEYIEDTKYIKVETQSLRNELLRTYRYIHIKSIKRRQRKPQKEKKGW